SFGHEKTRLNGRAVGGWARSCLYCFGLRWHWWRHLAPVIPRPPAELHQDLAIGRVASGRPVFDLGNTAATIGDAGESGAVAEGFAGVLARIDRDVVVSRGLAVHVCPPGVVEVECPIDVAVVAPERVGIG